MFERRTLAPEILPLLAVILQYIRLKTQGKRITCGKRGLICQMIANNGIVLENKYFGFLGSKFENANKFLTNLEQIRAKSRK